MNETPSPLNLDLSDKPAGFASKRVALDDACIDVLVKTMEATGRSASSVVRGFFLSTKPGTREMGPGRHYLNLHLNRGMTAGRIRHAILSAERIAPDTKTRRRQFTVYCPRGWLPAARATGKKLTELVMGVLRSPPPAQLPHMGAFRGRLNVSMYEFEERLCRTQANALGLSLPEFVGRRLAAAGLPGVGP